MTDIPDHLKFGYEHRKECDEHRARLIAEGMEPGSVELYFAVLAAYVEAHKNDPTFRERQATWREKNPTQLINVLTVEEIDYLVERLAGANDPLGISATEKLISMRGD
ncbi:hypothetical protein BPNPMPFG_002486 [Mesorhizobium sp. AR07]|uniref:hypothetical protein n=1 Tax=Mesorhizobium sp. AR07 TaxID=2865838 RepID=UPI00215EE704|nr:hypothetical protein [Mesorhizobium sp. AR07]UVK46778.1 hypothetical protein BPNPMPFG_002486 [Mesorhizobium sp. AR07]